MKVIFFNEYSLCFFKIQIHYVHFVISPKKFVVQTIIYLNSAQYRQSPAHGFSTVFFSHGIPEKYGKIFAAHLNLQQKFCGTLNCINEKRRKYTYESANICYEFNIVIMIALFFSQIQSNIDLTIASDSMKIIVKQELSLKREKD